MQALIDAEADPEARDEWGRTPLLHAAFYNQNAAVVQALTHAGANLEARNAHGRTALMYAAWYNENAAVVQALIDAGADATATNKDGETAWDLIQENEALERTPVYWALNDLRSQ